MTNDHAHRSEDHGQDWDGIYDAEQVWSGNPNDALVAVMTHELSDLTPARAVDVGCGEGADAVWLALQGWQVKAVDVSQAALARGRQAAEHTGADVATHVEWVCSDVAQAGLEPASFELVSAFYPALHKDAPVDLCALVAGLVAPGGALLFVHHAEVDRERALAHGFDPDNYLSGEDLVESLGDGWDVQRRETQRNVTEGRGAHHHKDIVLIARRHSA